MDWLLAPIDGSRPHLLTEEITWHARLMFAAWGIGAPVAILLARYFKVMPGQDWPRELDNRLWWLGHWGGQCAVVALAFAGFALIWTAESNSGSALLHRSLGYAVLALSVLQVASGLLRGTKGGPTSPAKDGSWSGDHYDMTRWRLLFETIHKSVGYTCLLIAAACIIDGLWIVNAPRWMWLTIICWWLVLAVIAVHLQRRGRAIDTYQAIWGPGSEHPGNQRAAVGWGMHRPHSDGSARDSGDQQS